jgi:NitT/TauT family transport system substrate-binding protein
MSRLLRQPHLLIFFLLIVLTTSCGTKKQQNAEGAPFRIAFNTWIGYSPLIIAKEKGFLTDAGLDVEVTMLEGIGEKNSALIRGDIDGVGHTADSAVTSAASGVDGKVVFVFDRSYGADGIVVDGSIETVADLEGKRVALEPGFTGHFLFLSVLADANLDATDVEIVPMDTGSAGAAFVAGSVDAAVTWEPWLTKASERQNARVLVTSKDKPNLIIDVLYMSTNTITQRPEEVQKLILAMGKATEWYMQNTDEGDRIIAKFWKLSEQEAKETAAGMRFMTLEENRVFIGTANQPGELRNTIQKASDLWLSSGITQKSVDPDALINYQGMVPSINP